MLDFILALEQFLPQWPENTKLQLAQLAQNTKAALPRVVDCLTVGLDRAVDVHEPISYREADRAFNNLKQRYHNDLEAREKRMQALRNKTLQAYTLIMEKVTALEKTKNWHNSYRTLSYFLGANEANLSTEAIIAACNDCLRLGVKAGINRQELGIWLQKGIDRSLGQLSPHAVEDALDFIDAFGEYFLQAGSISGEALITNQLRKLQMPATEFRVDDKFTDICRNLSIPVMTESLPAPGAA